MHTPSVVKYFNIFKYTGFNTFKVSISFEINPFFLYDHLLGCSYVQEYVKAL